MAVEVVCPVGVTVVKTVDVVMYGCRVAKDVKEQT